MKPAPLTTKMTPTFLQKNQASTNTIITFQKKTNDVGEKTLPPAISKSNGGITRHLKTSPEFRNAVCSNPVKRFRVLAKARNSGHLSFLEAVFISRLSPVLCAQKEFVRSLALF